jgi:hypothetical protein
MLFRTSTRGSFRTTLGVSTSSIAAVSLSQDLLEDGRMLYLNRVRGGKAVSTDFEIGLQEAPDERH